MLCFFSNVELDFTTANSWWNLKSESRDTAWVSKCDEYRSYWALTDASFTCLGFALYFSDTGWLDQYLLDADLDMLEIDIDSFPVNIFLFFKISGRHILKKKIFTLKKLFWRRLQCKSFLSSRTCCEYLEDVLKTSSRRWKKSFCNYIYIKKF